MDPNANLREQREIAKQLLNRFNQRVEAEVEDVTDAQQVWSEVRLAELVEALDKWLSAGGFLPDSWEIARKRAGGQG